MTLMSVAIRERRLLGAGKCRVYVIQMGETECYKIGVSSHPAKRFLQFNLPYDVRVVRIIRCADALKLERTLHDKFRFKRLKNEWFRLNADDLEFIQTMEAKK
jgi:hypothetical protein